MRNLSQVNSFAGVKQVAMCVVVRYATKKLWHASSTISSDFRLALIHFLNVPTNISAALFFAGVSEVRMAVALCFLS